MSLVLRNIKVVLGGNHGDLRIGEPIKKGDADQ